MQQYFKAFVLILGCISEGYLIYRHFTSVAPGAKSQVILLLHCVLLAFFAFAFAYTVKSIKNKKK